MDLTPMPARPGSPGAREGRPAPSGSNWSSKGARATNALLPGQLSPAGKLGDTQEVAEPSQEQLRLLEDVRQMARKVNDYMRLSDTHLEFIVTEGTGRIIVQVVDTDSEEVVRQIPPETMQRFSQTMDHLRGLLYEGLG